MLWMRLEFSPFIDNASNSRRRRISKKHAFANAMSFPFTERASIRISEEEHVSTSRWITKEHASVDPSSCYMNEIGISSPFTNNASTSKRISNEHTFAYQSYMEMAITLNEVAALMETTLKEEAPIKTTPVMQTTSHVETALVQPHIIGLGKTYKMEGKSTLTAKT